MSKMGEFIQGNQAVVEGALYAGLGFYAGYPITEVAPIGWTDQRRS